MRNNLSTIVSPPDSHTLNVLPNNKKNHRIHLQYTHSMALPESRGREPKMWLWTPDPSEKGRYGQPDYIEGRKTGYLQGLTLNTHSYGCNSLIRRQLCWMLHHWTSTSTVVWEPPWQCPSYSPSDSLELLAAAYEDVMSGRPALSGVSPDNNSVRLCSDTCTLDYSNTTGIRRAWTCN